MPNYRYVFFGTPHIAETALQKLVEGGLVPSLVVTGMDKKQGRGMVLTPTPVKAFAEAHGIPILTPVKITPEVISELKEQGPWDFFVVVAYGKILKQELLDIVNGKVINIHPSLLPKYRGPSPIESVLLSDDTETGVTVMEIDALVDHGPIIAQESFDLPPETVRTDLETKSAIQGADMILNHIEAYVSGTSVPTPQDHDASTHTKKIQKEDGDITTLASDWEKWKHFRAYIGWPGTYFYTTHKGARVRVKITKAHWDNAFVIDEVIPENQKPLPFSVFEKWLLD